MTNAFVPSLSYISAISTSQNAVVTFTAPHGYIDGEILSFRVSKPYGMTQINNQQSRVIRHDTSSVTTEIDSSFYTPFVDPGSIQARPAMAVPAGSGIIPDYYPVTVTLRDAFDQLPET